MNEAERKKRLAAIHAQETTRNVEEALYRARSITVGTSFGGTTEVIMRGLGSSYLFCIMQPVEVIELIHQLAANVGCHLHLQPRKDFSSWRNWKYTEEELLHYRGPPVLNKHGEEHPRMAGAGHAPHVNDMAPFHDKGQDLPPPEQQPGMNVQMPMKEQENVMATKKTVNRRSTKRTAKSS